MNSNYEIDFTTLNWVKQELEDTLKQARQSLESYVEDPQDASLMRFCASYLHQVQGTLRMVELYGAAMVVEEMERLAQALLEGKVRQTEEAYQILMRGMLQVPDYLDRLQSGHRDIPIVLLPLLNDLRACRGEKLLTETALFAPDLSRSLPATVAGPDRALPEPVLKANAARLRMAFQLGLLKWFKGEEISTNTARLALILDRLQSATAQIDGRRLWWVGGGLLDAVRADQVDSSVAVKLLVGKVDREIKNLVDHGEAWFVRQPPLELTKNLLYYLAQVDGAGERVDAIRELYGLRELLPSSDELEHARGVMSGANRQLLDTVGDAIKEDVLRVKDALDLFLRTGNGNVAELEPQREALQRVADTLGMLGLGVPRRLVLDQKDTVDQVVAGDRPADENTLLDIAGALLYVESSLDDHIAHLGRDSGAPKDAGEAGLELPQAEVRQILDATMKEAQTNVQQAKQDIVAFIESPWDHSKIEELPRLLEEITGALRMLNLPDAASLLHGITRFIDMELLKYRRVPSGEQLDLLADALASIEYYMEALRDQRGNRERILEVTQRSLEALGYWPLPEMLPEAELGAEAFVATGAESTQLPSFGGDFMAESSSAPVVEPVEDEHMLSIDLPPVEPVIAEPPVESAAEMQADDRESLGLQTAVEIAPGEGLEALVVGESNAQSSASAETELHGLSFDVDDGADAEVPEALAEESQSPAVVGDGQEEDAERSLDFTAERHAAEDGDTDLAPTPAAQADQVPAFSWEMEPLAVTGPDDSVDAELEATATASLEALPEAAISEPEPAHDAPRWYEASVEDLGEDALSEVAFDTAEVEVEDVSSDALAEALASESVELTELSLTSDFELDTDLDSTLTAALEPVIEEAPATVAPVMAPVVPPTPALEVPDSGFQAVPSDEIDEEIREVFVEEVQDELENLNRQYPAWAADQGDQEKLKPVRRSFHTLKGSGRLVGALAIGEFSWKIENMLNRVLDKTIPVSPAMLDLMDKAIAALPELLAALRGEGPPQTNIGAIMWCADRLAAGEEVWLPKSEPAPTADDQVAAAPEAGTQAAVGSDESSDDSAVGASADATAAAPEAAATALVDDTDGDLKVEPTSAVSAITDEPVGASPLDVDPVLMEILRSEVSAHLQTVRDYLGEWYAQGEAMMATEELLRAVHTLNGAVSMVELPAIAGLVSPLEGYLKRARGHDLPVERRAADLLTEAADAIDACMLCLERSEALPDLQALIDAAVALRDDLPVVERGYQAFGIHMAEEPAHEEAETDPARSPETDGALLDGTNDVDDRPWYEAELGDEAAALLDELDSEGVVRETADQDARGPIETARPWYEAESSFEEDVNRPSDADADAASTTAAVSLAEVDVTEVFDASLDVAEPAAVEPEGPVESAIAADPAVAKALADADLDAFIAEAAGELAPSDSEPADLDVQDVERLADLEMLGVDEGSVAAVNTGPDVGATTADGADAAEDALTAEDFDWLNADDDVSPEAAADLVMGLEPVLDSGIEPAELPNHELVAPDAAAEVDYATSAAAEIQPEPALALEEFELELDDLADIIAAEPDGAAEGLDRPLPDQADTTADGAVEMAEDFALDDLDLGELIGAEGDIDPQAPSVETTAVEAPVPDAGDLDELAVEATSTTDAPAMPIEVSSVADVDLAPLARDSHQPSAIEPVADSTVPTAPRARMPVDPHPEAPLDTSDLDEELLDIFLQEGAEILDQSDSMMAELRQAPDDREVIAGLQRELHTLKGGARMAGVAPIGDLSHAMESLFEALVEGRTDVPGRHMVDVLEHSFDALHRMVQRVRQGKAIATPDQTIGVLESLERGELPSFLSEAPSRAMADTVPVEVVDEPTADDAVAAVETAKPVPIQPPRPERLRRTAMDEEEPQRMMQQEVIRVRADLIDNLVNFAGEVSIYRSRLEAQIGGFRFNLVEFDQTVTRLREQLRKLEMETEAQILSRYQREMENLPGNPEFDPLELDRFSTLQQLSRALAESVSDLLSLQNLMDDIARQSETLLLQQSRVSSDLQEGLMRTRMVPFESLVPRLRRIMRQTSGELGKRAQLRVEGAQGEMDRTVLERMTAPLEHMLRNALAHGLETPEHRRIIGKPEEGTIGIHVSRDATEVVIRITDDGRGMDRDAIRSKAVERGLIRDDAQLTDRDLFQFVLETGFSTATEVSKIAGRGVGMDVVNSEIRQLGGSLQIDSERGRGTVFTVRLPFTLAVTQAILIKLADALFAVPMTSIQGVMRMSRKDFEQRQIDQQTEVTYGGETYHIYDLGDLLGNPVNHTGDDGQIPLVMTRTGDQRAAIRVSTVIGSREIVVKSVGPQLSSVPGFFGATIMGDGSVVVILDLAPLVRHGAALRQAPELAAEIEAELPPPAPVRKAPLVMVVDDSITMRKVTSRVLERHELDVVTAKDGLDAVEQLQDKVPDVMLLDIEMPRMDGYELATYMKNDPRLRKVPIIMITSRTGEKHRQRALEIGVERYLGKPYQENDLLQNVREALGQGATDGVN